MAPEVVARVLGAEPRIVREDGQRRDQFVDLGFLVSYSAGDETVEHIDTAAPAELEYDGLIIAAGRPLAEVLAALEARGEKVVQKAPDLWVVSRLGAAIWAPGEYVEAAGAFRDSDYFG